MFEKCGLKDIFYRIFVLKWCAIAMVVILTIAGIGAYVGYSSIKGGSASTSTSSQLTYYVQARIGDQQTTNYDPNTAAGASRSNFINTTEAMMKSKAVGKDIYDMLLEVFTEEEIRTNIGSIGLDWQNYYKNFYTLDTEKGSAIIIDINASTDAGIEAATKVVKVEMEKIAKTIDTCNLSLYSESYVTSTGGSNSGVSLSKKLIAEIIIIAVVLTLIIMAAISIFCPTVNRGSDIDEYGVTFLGIVSNKNIEVSARIIEKMMEDKGIKKLAIASSLKKNNYAETIKKINDDLGDGLEVVYAKNPAESGDAFDLCFSADAVLLLERRGFSKHKDFAEMLNLLVNFDANIIGGMLQ